MIGTMNRNRDENGSHGSNIRYRLVEAEPESVKNNNQSPKNFFGNQSNTETKIEPKTEPKKGGGRGKFNGKKGPKKSAKPFNRNSGISYYEIPESQSRKMAAEYALKQIEFYFSVENLCGDLFLRSYMDCEGFIPIAFVANFPGVVMLGATYDDILEGIRSSEILEMDEINETMRLKNGWDLWLLPNSSGSLGVPRYIKLEEIDEGGVERITLPFKLKYSNFCLVGISEENEISECKYNKA